MGYLALLSFFFSLRLSWPLLMRFLWLVDILYYDYRSVPLKTCHASSVLATSDSVM